MRKKASRLLGTFIAQLLAFVLLQSSPAFSAVVQKKSLDALVSESPVVFIGTVTGLQYTTLEGSEKPYTEYSVYIQEFVNGAGKAKVGKGDMVKLYFAGGLSKRGFFDVIGGIPTLELAQTYLLMLKGGQWNLNPISGWNQGAFRVVGLNGKGDKLVVSLDGAILVSIKDSKLEFFYPDLSGVRNRFQPQPPQGKSEGGLRLNDQSVTVVQPDAQLKTHTYREDNVKELEKEDTKRAEVGSIEPLQISEEELLAKAMGGVRPVLLKEFVDDILTRAKKVESHLQQLEFSFKPIPLPDVLENETPPKS